MLTVTYVTMQFPKPSEAFASQDVAALVRLGVDVRVLTMRLPCSDHDALVLQHGLETVRIERMSVGRLVSGALRCLRHPLRSIRLFGFIVRHTIARPSHFLKSWALIPSTLHAYSVIERDPPDVVHLFWGHFPALVGYLVQRHLPGVVVSQFLGAYDLEYGYGPTVPVARGSNVLWTHARANLPAISARGIDEEQVTVVHRGVVVSSNKTGTAEKKPGSVVSAGRLVRAKAFDDVLAVFAEVRKQVPGATLAIVGDGEERDELERRASRLDVRDAVQFSGHIAQDDLFQTLERCEVFLLMSVSPSERLPNVIKEASLRGCATVTTESVGIEELVEDGVDGFVVPRRDVQSAARRVVELLNNPRLRSRMSASARKRIEAHFDVAKAMSTYVARWSALAAQKREVS